MDIIGEILQWFSGISQTAVGFLFGTFVGGAFTWKVVVPKVMKNKDIQKLQGFLKQLVEFLKSKEYRELTGLFWEATNLFKEAVPILKEILEKQKEILENQKNHAAP